MRKENSKVFWQMDEGRRRREAGSAVALAIYLLVQREHDMATSHIFNKFNCFICGLVGPSHCSFRNFNA